VTNTLKDPSEYMEDLRKLRLSNPYAKNWKLRLETKTNRHPETNGGSWGWYEIFPLGMEIGCWGTTEDDLKGVDFNEWNAKAAMLDSNRLSTMTEKDRKRHGIEPAPKECIGDKCPNFLL
jgi:hypothetical protein